MNTDRSNEEKRNIPRKTFWPAKHIGEFLKDNIPPERNFIINGAGKNRTSTLFQRILQLYLDETVLHRPLIILSSNSKLLDRLEEVISNREIRRMRLFAKIDQKNTEYKPFAGMDALEIEQALAVIADSDKTMPFERWNSRIFRGVCKILEKYNYELSLDNLRKLFIAKREDIIRMLRAEGLQREAEQPNENDFSDVFLILDSVYQKFREISSYENGTSLLEKVRLKGKENKNMPCFCFNIADGIRKYFLDYLSKELEFISVLYDPIIVIDSIPFNGDENGKGDHFFEYISNALKISLTLSAEACDALIPSGQLESFVKTKGFTMCFTRGGASGENLTKIELGTYDHATVENTRGTVTQTFHFISHDKHDDIHIKKDPKWLRICSEDLRELADNAAYFVYRTDARLVVGLNFTEEICKGDLLCL